MTLRAGVFGAAAALISAAVLVGCGSSSSGGTGGGFGGGGGIGGEGGQGGVEPAMVRMVHLATDVPRPDRTEVNFFMLGSGSFRFIGYGIVTGHADVEPGLLVVEARTLGRGDVLATVSAEVESGGRYTFIAHRDDAQASSMSFVVFDEDLTDLSATQGRLWVGHGVDDATWDAAQVVLADGGPMPLAVLALGEQTPPIDLDAGPHGIGFDIALPSPEIDVGPYGVDVRATEPLILFAVDRDTDDLSVTPQVFAIGPDAFGPIDPVPEP